jgi:hypothetical protein
LQLALWGVPQAPASHEPGDVSTPPHEHPPRELTRLATTPIPGGDEQTWVRFSPDDPTELVTNGARRVYFWRAPPQLQQRAAAAAAASAVPATPGAPGAASQGAVGGSGGRCTEQLAPMSYYSPPLAAADFRQAVGAFLASVFVPGTTQVRRTGPHS